jgi:hypothetical protein
VLSWVTVFQHGVCLLSIGPQLALNEREEAFCQLVAKGADLVVASIAAGYNPDPGNASRRAQKPKIKMRIEEIKQELRDKRALTNEQDEAERTQKLKEEGVTMAWLVQELKDIVNQAKGEGKFRDAIEGVKTIAQISGHIRGGGVDHDPNRMRPNHGNLQSYPPPAVAVQVVNQYADLADRIARIGDEEGDDAALPAEENRRGNQRLLESRGATSVAVSRDGAPAELLFEPAEGEGADEPILLRRVHDTG